MLKKIIERWRELDWLPPLPNLDRHVEHIAGGLAIAFIFITMGAGYLTAACVSSGLFFVVEFATALIVGNWRDSAFDFIQYQFHWPFYFAAMASWWLFAISLTALLLLYFTLLLARW